MLNIDKFFSKFATPSFNPAVIDEGAETTSQANFFSRESSNFSLASAGWLANLSMQTQDEGRRRRQRVGTLNGLPDTMPLTEAARYDYYTEMAASRGQRIDTAPGQRTILGLRVPTNTTANSTATVAGRGVYDDRLVVLWTERDRQGNTVKRVRQFWANTEPGAQYDRVLAGTRNSAGVRIHDRGVYEGRDANGDDRADAGRLPDGAYTYERSSSRNLGAVGRRVLRPATPSDEGLLVDRDVNHDGNFDAADRQQINEYRARLISSGLSEEQAQRRINAALNSDETILIHQGGPLVRDRQYNVTQQNTGSAGCQTIVGNQFDEFWQTLGNERETNQRRFTYILMTMPF